ncbi:MAG: hypothetical protein K2J10_02190 [Muribaculaceae bacterium]|nr:hypothetical protein [Muribaculaceae bacterium]
MKRILLLFAIAAVSLGAFALQPQRGYRGFIDWDNSMRQYPQWMDFNKKVLRAYSGVSTSHGYQFNPNFFLGAGIAVQYNSNFKDWILPVFLHVRTDQKFGKYTPFGDMRIGYSLTDGGGVYFSPMVGYRFNWGRKMGVNIGAGLTVKQITYTIFDVGFDNMGFMNYIDTGKKGHHAYAFFAVKVGIDF